MDGMKYSYARVSTDDRDLGKEPGTGVIASAYPTNSRRVSMGCPYAWVICQSQ